MWAGGKPSHHTCLLAFASPRAQEPPLTCTSETLPHAPGLTTTFQVRLYQVGKEARTFGRMRPGGQGLMETRLVGWNTTVGPGREVSGGPRGGERSRAAAEREEPRSWEARGRGGEGSGAAGAAVPSLYPNAPLLSCSVVVFVDLGSSVLSIACHSEPTMGGASLPLVELE